MPYSKLTSHHNYLWCTSWLTLVSCVVAVNKRKNTFTTISIGAFITSLTYWGDPQTIWKRRLDMTWIHCSFLYQLLNAHKYENKNHYYLFSSIASASYALSLYTHQQKKYIMSTGLHSLVHLFGNVANVFLYSSK